MRNAKHEMQNKEPGEKWRLLLSAVAVLAFLATATANSSDNPQANPTHPTALDYSYFLRRLIDLDRLPFLEPGVTCRQFSSYDRRSTYDPETGRYVDWSANEDWGNYLRLEGEEAVMAEMEGPGCIYRIWSANPVGEIRFYLDGATEPTFAFDFAQMFSGELYPFVPPFVWQRTYWENGIAQASLSYLPIPYANCCKVTIYPRMDMYYQIGYQTFPKDARVETFDPDLSQCARETLARVRSVLRNAFDASTMTTEAGRAEIPHSIGQEDKVPPDPQPARGAWFSGRHKRTSREIRPGSSAILASIEGPAVITSFRAHLECADSDSYRTAMLHVHWDDETVPAIETPLVEFFGSSFGPSVYHSLPMGRTSDWLYSNWRMPFRKNARIVVVNESAYPATIKADFTWRRTDLPPNTAHFHAKWRRDAYSHDFDYPVLECEGRGRFVGMALFVHNLKGNWWGEGDEKIFVDGEVFPSTFGTGSEDYFGDAWGMRWYCLPFAGCPYTSDDLGLPGQKQTCFRWHVTDFIPFEKSLKVVMENYSALDPANVARNDYISVAYWYQMPAGTDFYESHSTGFRAPRVFRPETAIEAESLFAGGDLPAGVSNIGANETGERVSGEAGLRFEGQVGAEFTLPIKPPFADEYRIELRTVAPTNATFEIRKDGEQIHTPVFLEARAVPITLRLSSKPAGAEAAVLLADYVDLIPERRYVVRWLVTGAFGQNAQKDFDRVFPPEEPFDRRSVFRNRKGQLTGWFEATADPITGALSLSSFFPSEEEAVVYATCVVESPCDQAIDMFVGSDDGVKVWINNEVVLSRNVLRVYVADQDHVRVNLKKGRNLVLAKVTNGAVYMALSIRFATTEHPVRYSLPK